MKDQLNRGVWDNSNTIVFEDETPFENETRYDFSATADFLNFDMRLSDIYKDVLEAMRIIGNKNKLSNKEIIKVWGILLTCADLIDTIQIEKGGTK